MKQNHTTLKLQTHFIKIVFFWERQTGLPVASLVTLYCAYSPTLVLTHTHTHTEMLTCSTCPSNYSEFAKGLQIIRYCISDKPMKSVCKYAIA